MGCKEPLDKNATISDLPIKLRVVRIQSLTLTFNLKRQIDLSKLGNYCHQSSIGYIYEPELFPALRLIDFNPLCVNVFSKGGCVILGVRHLCFHKYVIRVTQLINRAGCYVKTIDHAWTNSDNFRQDGSTTNQCYSTTTQRICETTVASASTKEDEEETAWKRCSSIERSQLD